MGKKEKQSKSAELPLATSNAVARSSTRERTAPKTRVEWLDLDACIAMAHPNNPKEHDVDELAESFRRFGFVASPLIDEATGIMAAGHGRCKSLAMMRDAGEGAPSGIDVDELGHWYVPVIRGHAFANEQERDAYVIADNQHTIHGGWNLDRMTAMLRGLKGVGFKGLGFNSVDLQSFGIERNPLAAFDNTKPEKQEGNAESDQQVAGPGSKNAINADVYDKNQIAEATFEHYRRTGFPYPNPSLWECMLEINRLASMELDQLVKTTVGYGVADKFQPHRFAASAEDKFSPLDSFNDDDQLKRAIDLSLQFDGSLTEGAIRGVISLVKNTQACSNFRPGFAAYMYRRFCPPGGTVLDTSTGYGGRLVGAIASTVVGHYIGIDPNTPTVEGNRRLLKFLGRDSFATLIESPAEDVSPSTLKGRCDFAFTSPPYFRKEHYSEDDTQSWKRYPEADAWREKFLVKMIELTSIALKPGAHCAVNIGDVLIGNVRHPLGDWTVDAAKRIGLKHVATLDFPMSRRFGANQKEEVAAEPVFVFVKP